MTIGSMSRRIFLSASVAVTGALSFAALAGAQDDPEFEPNSYVTFMTEEEIGISGDTFVISDVLRQNYPDGENEQVFIDGTLDGDIPAVLEVTWLDDSDTPDQTIELWVSGLAEAEGIAELEVVDAGLDGDVYWYYVTGALDDQEFIFYIQVTEDVMGNTDRLESVLTIEGSLVDVVSAAQQEISVGENAFMGDIDLDDLQGLTEGEPFRDGQSDDPGVDSDDAQGA